MRLPVMTQTGALAWIRAPGIVQAQHDPALDDDHQMLDDGFAAFFRSRRAELPVPLHARPAPRQAARSQGEGRGAHHRQAWSETGDTVDLKISPTWRPSRRSIKSAIAIDRRRHAQERDGAGRRHRSRRRPPRTRAACSSSRRRGFLTNPFARSGAGHDLGGQFADDGPRGRRRAAADDRRSVRTEVPHRHHPLVQEHARLDERRLGSHRGERQDPGRGQPHLRGHRLAPSSTRTTTRTRSRRRTRSSATLARTRSATSSSTLTLLCPVLFAGFGIFRWRRREGGRANHQPRLTVHAC